MRPANTNRAVLLQAKASHPASGPQKPTPTLTQPRPPKHRPSPHPPPTPFPFSRLDNPKVEVMMPDVTNQADKEQGLLWTVAQLWVQLRVGGRASSPARSEREKRKKKRDGEEEETAVLS